MPIEFRCPDCSALVRVPDSAAGKKGRCPTCSSIVPIPAAGGDAGPGSTSASSGPSATLTADGKLEFACLSCAKPVRVPASSAGKKGRCPHCQTIVEIPSPASSVASGQAASQQAPAGSVEFNCPLCAKLVKTPASAAGKKGRCPHCKGVVDIPLRSTAASGVAPGEAVGRSSAPSAAASGPIEFPCPRCGNNVKTPASAAGKKGKCPKCQSIVDIPLTSQRPATPAAPAAFGGLTPLGDGLEPLGGGLEPLGGGWDSFGGGLEPLGGGGLSPLQGQSLNAFADPLGELSAPASPSAFSGKGSASFNPYAAPSASGKTPARGNDGARGLPWDRRSSGREKSPFFNTAKLILMNPKEAFQSMLPTDGFLGPMLFCLLGNLTVNIAWTLYTAMFLGVMMLFIAGDNPGEGMVVIAINLGQNLVTGAVQSAMRAFVGIFVWAGITHLLLMMVKGANKPYETTFRTLAYVDGALSLVGAIPCVGPLITIIGMFIYPIFAIMYSHRTHGGKASFAILFPYFLCIAACVGIYVLFAAFLLALFSAGNS